MPPENYKHLLAQAAKDKDREATKLTKEDMTLIAERKDKVIADTRKALKKEPEKTYAKAELKNKREEFKVEDKLKADIVYVEDEIMKDVPPPPLPVVPRTSKDLIDIVKVEAAKAQQQPMEITAAELKLVAGKINEKGELSPELAAIMAPVMGLSPEQKKYIGDELRRNTEKHEAELGDDRFKLYKVAETISPTPDRESDVLTKKEQEERPVWEKILNRIGSIPGIGPLLGKFINYMRGNPADKDSGMYAKLLETLQEEIRIPELRTSVTAKLKGTRLSIGPGSADLTAFDRWNKKREDVIDRKFPPLPTPATSAPKDVKDAYEARERDRKAERERLPLDAFIAAQIKNEYLKLYPAQFAIPENKKTYVTTLSGAFVERGKAAAPQEETGTPDRGPDGGPAEDKKPSDKKEDKKEVKKEEKK